MDELGQLWNEGVVHSLVQALRFLREFLVGSGLSDVPIAGDLSWGLAIILFTAVIKLITLPLTMKQLRSSKAMQVLQPQIKELQKKYGKDRERLMQEQMRLYRENKINPAAGCLPMLIQMPVWFGLYQALFALASNAGDNGFDRRFLWLENLSHPESFPYLLALLTGVSQWVVQRMMMTNSTDPQQQMMNKMMQFMPIMFVFFAFQVPSGLVLYWVTSNVFSIVQQYFIMGWGMLFPLPFIGGPARVKEISRVSEPNSNGQRPALGEATDKTAADITESSSRGPGGGRKKRVKRR